MEKLFTKTFGIEVGLVLLVSQGQRTRRVEMLHREVQEMISWTLKIERRIALLKS